MGENTMENKKYFKLEIEFGEVYVELRDGMKVTVNRDGFTISNQYVTTFIKWDEYTDFTWACERNVQDALKFRDPIVF